MNSQDNQALWRFWLEQGWKVRRRENPYMASHLDDYRARLKHELKVIEDKGFQDYFMIMSDIIRWAKRNEIAVGPGRGSSAGSLVCYLLQITEIDPMQYPMLFERFMDPTRTDLPDIDTDFEDERRDEVFAYAARKYGQDRVANIINFVRYKGRNTLDDIARVYHIPSWKIDSIKSKLLERAEGHPRALKTLEDTYDSFDDIKEIFDTTEGLKYALTLEGNYRNLNVHAAAMVISSVPMNDMTATYQREIGDQIRWGIAYDKRDATYLGLLKVDILSLKTMGMIARVCNWTHKKDSMGNPYYAKPITLRELYRLEMDDPKVLGAFGIGDVLGIFQFEGGATRRICKSVRPTTFQHLADINALSRPGADEKAYIATKNAVEDGRNGARASYIHPIMEQHLDWTYGTFVYEEQILFILRDLGGFKPEELNKMRKIFHDKLGGTALAEYYQRWVKGCAAHGVSTEDAKSVWDTMSNASAYVFCVTGDTLLERPGRGSDPSTKITVKELYERQQSRTPIGEKIRGGRLSLLTMSDDGRIRHEKLLKIHDPVPYRCTKIVTEGGRTLTMSNDHIILSPDKGYVHALSLSVGDELVVDLGWKARDKERIENLTKYRKEDYKEWDGIKGEGNPGWIDGRKQKLSDTYDLVWIRDSASCKHCGKEWDGTIHGLEFAHIMTLEHFDGDYIKYHDKSNVMLLCNSCHKNFDYQVQGSRKKQWSVGRPTGVDTIISIEDAGIQNVYDISMAGPTHNYIGNEFVNHNNIAHSVSYAKIAYWSQYLKIHYPAAFFASQLSDCADDVRKQKLIAEANLHGIDILPPDLINSDIGWEIARDMHGDFVVYAGFLSLDGIGPKTAASIIKWRKESELIYGEDDWYPEWDDLVEVKGIGKKTIDKIKSFVEQDDPFGVGRVKKTLDTVRRAFHNGELAGIASPTHTSVDLTPEKQFVCFMGIVRKRKYYDAVEQLINRSSEELDYQSALAELSDPHLLKYAALYLEDEHNELIRVGISRWKYPDYEHEISHLKMDKDVVLVRGYTNDFAGISIQCKDLTVLEV